MRNQTIIDIDRSDITTSGYMVYVHAGRLIAVGHSRWQGSTTDDRWIYAGDIESYLAAMDLEDIQMDIQSAIYGESSRWKRTSRGFIVN